MAKRSHYCPFLAGFVAAWILACQTSTLADNVVEPFYELDGFHREVSTDSKEAQLWFDRGLLLCYGFNHEEAIRCFERALEADPDCAMAYWGIAYASGPNINNIEMDDEKDKRAWEAAKKAESLVQHRTDANRSADVGTGIGVRDAKVPDVERALIAALQQRYQLPAPEDRTGLERAYADAMREVYEVHRDDPDVAALFAESLMILRPWKHWSPEGEPAAETPEIVATLESSLAHWPDHPALCHFYIHSMEMSPQPEKALPAAERLRQRATGPGHLVHMPSHIDVRLGRYDDAIMTNQHAIDSDQAYFRVAGGNNFYTLYRVHAFHFVVYAAMFDGQSELALDAARELVEQIPDELLVKWTDYVDAFVPTPLHALIRFGRWDEILSEPIPSEKLPVTRAVWHYARGIALATKGRLEQALAEQRAFKDAAEKVPETSILFNNKSRDILAVAEAMLEGEIEYRRGKFDAAFDQLEQAVRRDDALNYDEPWGWMQPARHALGALLLEQGRWNDAEEVYREDLLRHPENLWSLHGLAECLRQSSQLDEAVEVERRFEKAATRADVDIRASCYCRFPATP
jgi:tetratricopeptide (TPR) repeat protein